MASQDWFEKDFYAVLGVPSDADDAAIKKAYRKLARQYHPDKNAGDAAAEQKFKDITEAHSVLSDAKQRQEYDAIRQMARGGARFTAGGPGDGGTGGFEDVFSQMFGGGQGGNVRFDTGGAGQPNLEDLLGGLFGQQGGFGQGGFGQGGFGQTGRGGFGGYGAPRGPQPGHDIAAKTTLSFRDAVTGSTVTLSGLDGQRITTRIPAGVKDGQKIKLRGKGGEGDPGAPKGDLVLTVTVEPHPVFGRDGDNLTVDLPVTFAEAALGATVSVPTLDGKPVKVKIAAGTPAGRVLRVKGRGVQTRTATGDLLAKVAILVPQRLSDEAKAAVEALRDQEAGGDPRADLFREAAKA